MPVIFSTLNEEKFGAPMLIRGVHLGPRRAVYFGRPVAVICRSA